MSNELVGRDQMGIQMVEEGAAPQSVVEYAVSKGVTPEALEKLIALQERVADRNARMAFVEAMAAFQAECPPIKKNKTAAIVTKSGAKYGYTYSSLDMIANTVRPLLHKHGLSYTWDSASEGKDLTCRCTIRHIDGHSESATFTCPTDTRADVSGSQAVGGALTYARRQSLVQALGLTTTDDDVDGAEVGTAETITESQAADLYALVQEVGADLPRFLKFMGVESLDSMPASQLQRAITELGKKRGRK